MLTLTSLDTRSMCSTTDQTASLSEIHHNVIEVTCNFVPLILSELLLQIHKDQQLPNTICHLVSTSSGATGPPIGCLTANYTKSTNEWRGYKLESDTAPRQDSAVPVLTGIPPDTTRMLRGYEEKMYWPSSSPPWQLHIVK